MIRFVFPWKWSQMKLKILNEKQLLLKNLESEKLKHRFFYKIRVLCIFPFRIPALFTYSHHYHDVTTLASRSILPIEVVVLFVESKLKITKTSLPIYTFDFSPLEFQFYFFIFYFWPFLYFGHHKIFHRFRTLYVIIVLFKSKLSLELRKRK